MNDNTMKTPAIAAHKFRSEILGIDLYMDYNTQEVFTTIQQAAIACYTSREMLLKDIPYRPQEVLVGTNYTVKIGLMLLTDFLHKYRPTVLSACVAHTAPGVKLPDTKAL